MSYSAMPISGYVRRPSIPPVKLERQTSRPYSILFDKGLFDEHHSPRNAVIGSIKKTGEVNPKPVLRWTRKYLHHPDKEIRREICHGIELRGRKHPG